MHSCVTMQEKLKVEVGQRWGSRYHAWWEIVRQLGIHGYWVTRNDAGETSQCAESWLLSNGEFLGWAPGYGPQPPAFTAFGPELSLVGRLEHVEDLLELGFIDQKTAARLLTPTKPDGEIPSVDGVPQTALQKIQARKPPEPWRPSVDEWDLLPDAGR